MNSNTNSRITRILNHLKDLRDPQLILIERIAANLVLPYKKIHRLETSDVIDECALYSFGDYIRVHHCISVGPFEKKRFEYALEAVLKSCGHTVSLARMGNPGYDIIINGEKISLKSQADSNIKPDEIHVSKWMELGKGNWRDSESDLNGLRDQFLNHINNYDRIFTLRCLQKAKPYWHYELVEIPKELLIESRSGELRMMHDSKQNPKPGYCTISDRSGDIKYQLYFDGGGERKLQVKKLQKDLCTVHAIWVFPAVTES